MGTDMPEQRRGRVWRCVQQDVQTGWREVACMRPRVSSLLQLSSPLGLCRRRALDQLEDDMGRVDLAEQWRPYSRLHMQQPEGPPLTKIQKLRVRAGATACLVPSHARHASAD